MERDGKLIWWEQWNGVLSSCGGWASWWFLAKSAPWDWTKAVRQEKRGLLLISDSCFKRCHTSWEQYYTWPVNYKSILTPVCCGFVALFTLKYLFNQGLSWNPTNASYILISNPIVIPLNIQLCFSSHTGKNLQPQYKVITMDDTVPVLRVFYLIVRLWGWKMTVKSERYGNTSTYFVAYCWVSILLLYLCQICRTDF